MQSALKASKLHWKHPSLSVSGPQVARVRTGHRPPGTLAPAFQEVRAGLHWASESCADRNGCLLLPRSVVVSPFEDLVAKREKRPKSCGV